MKRKQNAIKGLDLLLHIKSKIITNYATKSGLIIKHLYSMFKKTTLHISSMNNENDHIVKQHVIRQNRDHSYQLVSKTLSRILDSMLQLF